MADHGETFEKSWILHHILERMIGSRDLVSIKRKMIIFKDYVESDMLNLCQFTTGSFGEGVCMKGSDVDLMFTTADVEVISPNQISTALSDNGNTTFLVMRKNDCRPCYVALELVKVGQSFRSYIYDSVVPIQDRPFISSELFRTIMQDQLNAKLNIMTRASMENHGPASCLRNEDSTMKCDVDVVVSFRCNGWPPEANEWLTRVRQHGWPEKTLIEDISRSGCHLVPVGDKTSADTFLQWRISFATAERKLVHSLSHEQLLVHGLLKYFLRQMPEIVDGGDILSSYIMKTVLFFAVEGTPRSFWKEQNLFLCFRLCLKMLIIWVNAGYCPNYFIASNNMFKGKCHGRNQEILLRFLEEMYDRKWECLSGGEFIQPSLGSCIQNVMNGAWEDILLPPETLEYERDREMFTTITLPGTSGYHRSLCLLLKSNSCIDEEIAYLFTVQSLSHLGMATIAAPDAARGNKERYKHLKKRQTLMQPYASVCTSPGGLLLATYAYRSGNYIKSLAWCENMISSFKLFICNPSNKDIDIYQRLYCGRGYTNLYKCQVAMSSHFYVHSDIVSVFPTQLRHYFKTIQRIPPRPYAIFLSFLCYHELGDTRRRDEALISLCAVKYDEFQGGSAYWIVHIFLGICYETVRDTRRAIREYRESLYWSETCNQYNPALQEIIRLSNSQENTS